MALQIFVEDKLSEAYTTLAQRALGLTGPVNRRTIQTSYVEVREMTSFDGLFELTERSHRAGRSCIIFVLDCESAVHSPDRQRHLNAFRSAFRELCNHLANSSEHDSLKYVKVAMIVTLRCLEGWLLSDPQAIVDAMRRNRGVNYSPQPTNTENLTPQQACDEIAHHLRQIGRQLGRRDLQRTRANSVKRFGQQIAQHVNPDRARKYNQSLAYFFEMVRCETSGCDQLPPR